MQSICRMDIKRAHCIEKRRNIADGIFGTNDTGVSSSAPYRFRDGAFVNRRLHDCGNIIISSRSHWQDREVRSAAKLCGSFRPLIIHDFGGINVL